MKKDFKEKAAGLILAAGASTRMGQPKQLLHIATGNLLDHIINEAVKSELDHVVLVLGFMAEEIKRSINKNRDNRKLVIVENRNWENGISSSIITGVSAIQDAYDHCMVILADMPYISSSLINHLLHQYLASGSNLGAITTGRKRSQPVIFSRSLYSEIYDLKGDTGAKYLFKKYADKVCFVKPNNAYNDMDLDTPDDYLKYLNSTLNDKKHKDEKISGLFQSVVNHYGEDNSDVKKVFSALVKTTLNYRDHLLRDKGITVIVSDVRAALDALIPTLTTGRLPENIDKISLNLLKIWMDELKILGKNRY